MTSKTPSLRASLRHDWAALRKGQSGRRFRDYHRRSQQRERGAGWAQRILLYAVVLVCLLIGLLLSVLPGPAVLFFFVAGALLASESRWVAALMDGIEIRLRRAGAWLRRKWQRSRAGTPRA